MHFGEYMLNQCNNVGRKTTALTKLCKFISLDRLKVLIKAFTESQFGYYPLTWMFCRRHSNIHLYEKAVRVAYSDNQSSFKHLLKKDCSVFLHHRNLRSFGIEIYKVKSNIVTLIMSELFEKHNLKYDFSHWQSLFTSQYVNTVAYGLKSLKYFAGKVWSIVPFGTRNIVSLEELSIKIKSWKPDKCPCSLWLTYIHEIGHILC